jgi:hypothetical protein
MTTTNHYSKYPDTYQSAWVNAEASAAELAKQAAELIAAGKLAPDYASHCLTLAEVRRAVNAAAQSQDASPDTQDFNDCDPWSDGELQVQAQTITDLEKMTGMTLAQCADYVENRRMAKYSDTL